MNTKEMQYIKTFLAPIKKCKTYKPKFGKGTIEKGLSVQEFKTLYSSDPFYSWVGLDNDLMYAAHRAAGGRLMSTKMSLFLSGMCRILPNFFIRI